MSDIALPIHGASKPPLTERLLSDERLAKLAGRGDARAFATLYERHHQAIYRYCRSIVHNEHDAQDALQSAMTRAYAALCASERDLAVRPWLFRIAHNESISILRRRGREDELLDVHESLNSDVVRTAAERERLSRLLTDLRELPERQRATLLMRELSGLSIAEIAGALAVSSGAVKQTLFEARVSLHEYAEGRAMQCETVRRAISDRDGRVLRGRRLRAHLRDCADCRDFREVIDTRGADLRALAPPLPAAMASATLARLLAGGGGGHAVGTSATAGSALGGSTAGASATTGSTFGGHAAAALVAKGLATVAVVAAATAGAVHLATVHGGSTHRSHQALTAPRGSQAHAGTSTPTSTGSGRHATPLNHSSTAQPSRPAARLTAGSTQSGGSNGGRAGSVGAAVGGQGAHNRPSQSAHTNSRSHRAGGGAHKATARGHGVHQHSKPPSKHSKPSPKHSSIHRGPSKPVHPTPTPPTPPTTGSRAEQPTEPSGTSNEVAGGSTVRSQSRG